MTGLGVFTGTMLVVYNKIYLAGEMNNTPHHLLKWTYTGFQGLNFKYFINETWHCLGPQAKY